MDARRFAHDPNDATARHQALFAEQANAALTQTSGHPVPLEEQVLLTQNKMLPVLVLVWAVLAMVLAAVARGPLPWHQQTSLCA